MNNVVNLHSKTNNKQNLNIMSSVMATSFCVKELNTLGHTILAYGSHGNMPIIEIETTTRCYSSFKHHTINENGKLFDVAELYGCQIRWKKES